MKKKEELCILQKGFNGSTVFSLVYNKTRKPIITNKNKGEIASHIVREYPDMANRIVIASEALIGAEAGDINFSLIDPSHTEEIVHSIVQKFKARPEEKSAEKT